MYFLERLFARPQQPQDPHQALESVPDIAPGEALADVDGWFWGQVAERAPKMVLEAGTRQALPGNSTHCLAYFPWVARENYVMMDIQSGVDVDVVADLHHLPDEWTSKFDCFVASAVWEHLQRPWIAARELERVLAPGGIYYIATHQCFPLHAFPSDYFRFSREALRLILEDAGLVVDVCDYQHRCSILPPRALIPRVISQQWNEQHPSYLLVKAAGRKPA